MGVTIRVGGDYSLDMTDYDLDLSSMGNVYISSYNKTTISGYVGSLKVVINGKGFSYSDDGLVGGTVTGFTEKYGSSLYASVSGLNLSVKTIIKLAESGSENAIKSAVKTALAGADDIYGSNSSDVLFGYSGNDTISGNRGNDRLIGGAGNDKLIGGIGADALLGEGGKDTFVYKTVNESSAQLGVDTIFDFSGAGGDRIDLSGIDANTKTAKNDGFSFIGSKAFSGTAGELRVEKQASDTYVYGDTNGDKVADFQLHFDDPIVMSKGFFIL
ncbi:putative secreted protein (type I secretion substrate) [Rhizobium sp. PP-F2F-G20b]|nr:putative secreted protein (type I secretion substrate) [Rhizobium sp. PP-F2F-G20b]